MTLDVTNIKKDFPILMRMVGDKHLAYLDNAATSQRPLQVINAVSDYYLNHNANVHRGAHMLGDESTTMYYEARAKVAKFISADNPEDIIFTKNASDSLNMVVWGWAANILKVGDKVQILVSEHNSNVLPWLSLCKKTGAVLEYIKIDSDGKMALSSIDKNAKIIAMAHASNVLGTIFPVKEVCKIARENNIYTVIDGAQAIPHLEVNVKSLGCDFYAFSGHKMLGPMGIGVLWGRTDLLKEMQPFELGGGTVLDVNFTTYALADVPERFEAGTPDVAGAVGLAAAIDYLLLLGMENIRQHEVELSTYALKLLPKISGLSILGPAAPVERTGLVSFVIDGIHPHDVAAILNSDGVAVRSGMHCAMNLHKALNINASTRASYYLYNDSSDIDALYVGLEKAVKLLR